MVSLQERSSSRLTESKEAVVDADIVAFGRRTIEQERDGLSVLAASLNDRFADAIRALLAVSGRVIISGMGKSGHIAGKIAATLASTGTAAFFIHPAEAAHGDLGMVMAGDVVILISNSGETQELVPLIAHCKRNDIPIISISAGSGSLLARSSDIALLLPPVEEACPEGIAPTTSTTMTLALGDALAMAIMHRRGFSRTDFGRLHPGGKLGLRLMPVADLMHTGERLPLVPPSMCSGELIVEITSKSFGIAGVVDETGRLIGTITDGDLRRHLDRLATATAAELMNSSPKHIDPKLMSEQALLLMTEFKITSLFVTEGGKPVGLVHIHDFLRAGFAE